MINVNTDFISGKEIKETLGLVRGSTIRARHVGRDILASLKTIIGGEIKSYTAMINSAREQSLERMNEEAKKLDADAVINVRFVTAEVMQGAAEVLAYGTAVKFE
jgi:uncharacterized protein YbjQ (UPF0145 family)